ncbi:MAG: peptidase inhibitor family I36 protein, partial [Propionibacteriaceae bacterium]|nr:peptidase inhibitor family I36 protein [Propionibacteriaceae bacterium]
MKLSAIRRASNPVRILLTVVAAMAVSLTGVVLAPQAQAADTTNCPSGQFCYYYYADQGGSMRGYTGSVSTLAETYQSVGSGQGQAV